MSTECVHEWEAEYLPDPMSFGAVVPSGDDICVRCYAITPAPVADPDTTNQDTGDTR